MFHHSPGGRAVGQKVYRLSQFGQRTETEKSSLLTSTSCYRRYGNIPFVNPNQLPQVIQVLEDVAKEDSFSQ